MNEFSHLLESQNSVNNHRLAFIFSLNFLRFSDQIRVSHSSYYLTSCGALHFGDGLTAQVRR